MRRVVPTSMWPAIWAAILDFATDPDGSREQINNWVEAKTNVNLYLPKFRFDAPIDLKASLQALGMADAFVGGVADFSPIDGTRMLAITDVKHIGRVVDPR